MTPGPLVVTFTVALLVNPASSSTVTVMVPCPGEAPVPYTVTVVDAAFATVTNFPALGLVRQSDTGAVPQSIVKVKRVLAPVLFFTWKVVLPSIVGDTRRVRLVGVHDGGDCAIAGLAEPSHALMAITSATDQRRTGPRVVSNAARGVRDAVMESVTEWGEENPSLRQKAPVVPDGVVR